MSSERVISIKMIVESVSTIEISLYTLHLHKEETRDRILCNSHRKWKGTGTGLTIGNASRGTGERRTGRKESLEVKGGQCFK